ncbi:hypothetical protein PT286_04495 [Neisseriaceae bacterium ESL0693]|nr:hypothetical protein [Neisseriaceae bacterium ESL0693]
MDTKKQLHIAGQTFTIIRNLSNYRRNPAAVTSELAIRNLQIIGDLSEALHNLPMNNIFVESLVISQLKSFIGDYPEFKDYFQDMVL